MTGEYAQALPLLTLLVHTRKYSQAGVWLKLAECRHMLSDLEASAVAYSKVISLAPNHTESRLGYCIILGGGRLLNILPTHDIKISS